MPEQLRYEITAVITLNENAALLDEPGLIEILRSTGDVEEVDRIRIREMA